MSKTSYVKVSDTKYFKLVGDDDYRNVEVWIGEKKKNFLTETRVKEPLMAMKYFNKNSRFLDDKTLWLVWQYLHEHETPEAEGEIISLQKDNLKGKISHHRHWYPYFAEVEMPGAFGSEGNEADIYFARSFRCYGEALGWCESILNHLAPAVNQIRKEIILEEE